MTMEAQYKAVRAEEHDPAWKVARATWGIPRAVVAVCRMRALLRWRMAFGK